MHAWGLPQTYLSKVNTIFLFDREEDAESDGAPSGSRRVTRKRSGTQKTIQAENHSKDSETIFGRVFRVRARAISSSFLSFSL